MTESFKSPLQSPVTKQLQCIPVGLCLSFVGSNKIECVRDHRSDLDLFVKLNPVVKKAPDRFSKIVDEVSFVLEG